MFAIVESGADADMQMGREGALRDHPDNKD
jgi:hypothetical protein